MERDPNDQSSENGTGSKMGVGLAIGAGAGVALGVALDNIAVGIALGAGIGVALGAGFDQQSRRTAAEAEGINRRLVLTLVIGILLLGLLVLAFFLTR